MHRKSIAAGLFAIALALPAGSAAFAESAQTEAVLNNHLGSFGAGDVEAMLADYTADSVLITNGATFTGQAELKPFFEGLIAESAKPGMVFEMQHVAIHDDAAFIVWNAETADNVYEIASDTFVIRDGKIVTQPLTVKATSKN